MHSNYRGIAFLLSLGTLPIACGKGDKDSEGSGESTSPGTDGMDTGSTGTGPDGTTSPTSGATEMTTSPETGATDVTTSPETGETEGTTDPICVAYAAHYVECFPRYAAYEREIASMCAIYKNYAEMKDGPACGDAYEASLVCLTMTPCDELDNEPPDLPCEAEAEAEAEACPSNI